MKKIVIDFIYKNSFSALSKAREDVNRIAQRHGFIPFLINTRTTKEYSESNTSAIRQFLYRLRKIFILIRSILSIKNRTFVLLQYPLAPFGESFALFFCRCLKIKKCYLVMLIHDIDFFRYKEVFGKAEAAILNTASELIVHTHQMQKLLEKSGVTRPSRILWLFDYLTEEMPSENNYLNSNYIAFAGKLSKSDFLEKLKKVEYNDIQMHLYGNDFFDTANYPNWMKYIGRFSPENVTMLTEEWGLTWDGDSIEALHGPLGNYLKYNSSHKVSLYIAAGIPVVISKESALAEYVEENKLGITISSLLELENKITKLNKKELLLIRKHVAEMSAVLRTGGMLGTILETILKEKNRI